MGLYFVRHGQTDWNVRGKLQGKSDIALNETGRLQAVETRENAEAGSHGCHLLFAADACERNS